MKTETVKCHEVVDGKKVFVAEGPLEVAESLEDIILLNEAGLSEALIVTHFNASRRIELQRQLKGGGVAKVEKKARDSKIQALFSKASSDAKLTATLRELGLLD